MKEHPADTVSIGLIVLMSTLNSILVLLQTWRASNPAYKARDFKKKPTQPQTNQKTTNPAKSS